MREVIIQVRCDVCGEDIREAEEGSNTVTLVIFGKTLEMDICDECIHGSFIQEARPVTTSRRRPRPAGTSGPHACDMCDKRFSKPAGLSRHKSQTHGVKS